MRIYLDSCALQRPLDTADQVRIALEIEAIVGLYNQVDLGGIELVSSEVLDLEISRIVSPLRRRIAYNLLSRADVFVHLTEEIERKAQWFSGHQIGSIDALHLACAEAARCDYFCTCDDRFLRRAKQIDGLAVKPVSPVELIQELNL